jgi:hypothetical protein
MRAVILAVMILLLPFAAQADIIAACYSDCEAETDSNPEFKACPSRQQSRPVAQRELQDAARGDPKGGKGNESEPRTEA